MCNIRWYVVITGISVIDLLIDYRWNCCPRRGLAQRAKPEEAL